MNKSEKSLWRTSDRKHLLLGAFCSYCLSLVTLITFIFAMIAIPISGANAPGGGILYPYLDTIHQYPKDYIWQYLAMIMLCLYLITYIILKELINQSKRIFVTVGSTFAIMTTVILLMNYYIQVNVVIISLLSKEFEGIPLLTQYNPHGIFIALEELGYLLMMISFVFLIPVFWNKETKSKSISIIYGIGVIGTIIGLIIIHLKYGLDKQDRFEIVIISLTWLIMIINGILIGNKMKKRNFVLTNAST